MSHRKRRKGTGSVCQIKGAWHAYGPERRDTGRRHRRYLGSFDSKREALRHLDRAVAVCVLLALALVGCATPPPNYASRWGYLAKDSYAVAPTQTTPMGVRFDSQGQTISGALIDRLVGEVEACLAKSIDRASFTVLIPRDWTYSCDRSQQVLPAEGAGPFGCLAKGQKPSVECPCRWRAYIKWPNTIVTTPSLYLLKDALVRFIVDTDNPWADPHLAQCATPSTEPLSTGAGVDVVKQ